MNRTGALAILKWNISRFRRAATADRIGPEYRCRRLRTKTRPGHRRRRPTGDRRARSGGQLTRRPSYNSVVFRHVFFYRFCFGFTILSKIKRKNTAIADRFLNTNRTCIPPTYTKISVARSSYELSKFSTTAAARRFATIVSVYRIRWRF